MLLVVEQFLNGLQLGLLLFLLAAGLTLVFGIMDFVNLAHGSLYMMGAYFAATFVMWTGSFVVGALLALGATLLLGIALEFRLLDDFIKNHAPSWIADNVQTTMGTFTSGLGAHLTWTLPFGLLVMFAIFNRFDNRFEEAARDQGATPWQTLRFVILPIILTSVIGVGFFGFTLSWDEIARSSQAMGEHNTLPMELQALTTTVTTPEIYALGTATTGVSFAVIALALLGIMTIRARQSRHGSDAGQA